MRDRFSGGKKINELFQKRLGSLPFPSWWHRLSVCLDQYHDEPGKTGWNRTLCKNETIFEPLLGHPSTSYLCLRKLIFPLVPPSLQITPLHKIGVREARHEN